MEKQTEYAVDDTEGQIRKERLKAFAETLLEKRDSAVRFRAASGIERQWREDQAAFDGVDLDMGGYSRRGITEYATGDAYPKGNTSPNRSKVVINIIRGKCEIAEGRFCDILLPVDDRNWGLKTTPKPEMDEDINDDTPAFGLDGGKLYQEDGKTRKTIGDLVKQRKELAEQRMADMETEIDDQLTECSFNGESRACVRNAIRLGTGILKGPSPMKKIDRSWERQADGNTAVYVSKATESQTPYSKSVDPWCIFPDEDCGEDVKKSCTYIWEISMLRPRDVMDLVGLDGYEVDELKRVLKEEPVRTSVEMGKNDKWEMARNSAGAGSKYECWEFNGDVSREDMVNLGVIDEDENDIMSTVSICAVFINDRPVKIVPNMLDTGEIPYDFFQWTQTAGSPWGKGVARQGMWQQRVITSAWRATMDNAGDSAGYQVVLGMGITPADGNWEITSKKVWYASKEVDDIRKQFYVFQLANVQEQLQAIIELAIRFLDMETTLPMLFQGEQTKEPETLGATNIMVDSNNVALRSRVKLWDDNVTRPHLTRYYDWNMQYNKNDEIKGDYQVDPRGVSVLLAQFQQAQDLTELLQLRQDPELSIIIEWEKAIKQILRTRRLDVLKDEDKLEVDRKKLAERKPQNPQKEVAMIRAEGNLKQEQMRQQSDQAEIAAKIQDAEREREHDRQMKQMEFQMKMMEFAQAKEMKLADVKKELMVEASKQDLMVTLADKKTAQLTKPPVEPPQRAPAGEAYSQ